jgi:hypothetical protein
MTATIFFRNGDQHVVVEAIAVAEELLLTPDGFRKHLVCRDHTGHIVAQFDRDTVLGYRRIHSKDEHVIELPPSSP